MKGNNVKICDVCGRTSEEIRVSYRGKFDRILCGKHYFQLNKFGKILKRTEKDLNEIIKYDDYAEVLLYYKTKAGLEPIERARTIIDLESIGKICGYKWKITKQGYVYNHKVGLLSRFLLDMGDYKEDGIEVDHIDNNPLNNKISNLRKATSQQQKQNTRKIKQTKHKHKGVIELINGFKACVIKDGKKHYSQIVYSENEAGLEYNKIALELFGEFACLNEV